MKTRTVCGVAVNDEPHKTCRYERIDGVSRKVWVCPFYLRWVNMIKRCYSAQMIELNPTYADCVVAEEWLYFSAFKAWMESQDWHGKELDKDILIPGNKVYSKEFCVFVDPALNMFLVDRAASRGNTPLGVCWSNQAKKFMARCRNPFTDKSEYLGLFECSATAHEAWRRRKHSLALRYADMQEDKRVADALKIRFLK